MKSFVSYGRLISLSYRDSSLPTDITPFVGHYTVISSTSTSSSKPSHSPSCKASIQHSCENYDPQTKVLQTSYSTIAKAYRTTTRVFSPQISAGFSAPGRRYVAPGSFI